MSEIVEIDFSHEIAASLLILIGDKVRPESKEILDEIPKDYTLEEFERFVGKAIINDILVNLVEQKLKDMETELAADKTEI